MGFDTEFIHIIICFLSVLFFSFLLSFLAPYFSNFDTSCCCHSLIVLISLFVFQTTFVVMTNFVARVAAASGQIRRVIINIIVSMDQTRSIVVVRMFHVSFFLSVVMFIWCLMKYIIWLALLISHVENPDWLDNVVEVVSVWERYLVNSFNQY